MLTKNEIETILAEATIASLSAPPLRGSGCGRAYVCVSGEKAEITAVAAVCKKMGLLFQRKGYGVSNAIYMGYDNCDGRALAKAKAFAEACAARGLRAYDDAVAD